MNIRDLDLNLLVFLDALLKEGNVSRAAEQLGMTQPALSNGLTRLRKQLDDPLFVRTSRGMVPTEKALSLAEPVREALNSIRTAIAPKQPFDPAHSRRSFTIAGTDYVDHLIYPKVLRRLQQEAPKVSINSVRIMDSSFQALENGEIDAIIHTFDAPVSDAFHARDLFDEKLVAVVRKDHPCLKKIKKGKLDLDSYLQYGHIMITKTGVGKGYADALLAKQELHRHTALNVRQSALAPLSVILESDLIATIPARTAKYFETLLPIKILAIPLEMPTFKLTMAWGPIAHYSLAHKWLRNIIFDVSSEIEKQS